MKTLIFVAIVFAGLIAAGCTTTYLSLQENSTAQIEKKIIDYQQDENVGAEVTLSLKNGTEINGELLSVRDSAVTICTEHSATEEELTSLKYPINTVRDDEIQEITIEGSNYVWTGLGAGMLVGIGGYLLITTASVDVTVGALIGGGLIIIAASIVGPIVGYSLSTEEFVLQEIPPGYDLSILKPLARYPDEEPEYLRAIK